MLALRCLYNRRHWETESPKRFPSKTRRKALPRCPPGTISNNTRFPMWWRSLIQAKGASVRGCNTPGKILLHFFIRQREFPAIFKCFIPFLRRNKFCFPACRGLTLATVYYRLWGIDIHNWLSSHPVRQTLSSTRWCSQHSSHPREMLTLVPPLWCLQTGVQGSLSFGCVPSSAIPCHHLSQSTSPQS